MPNRTIVQLIVLVVVIAAVIFFVTRKSDDETITPILSVTAENQTKNVAASSTAAHPGDVIKFILTAENQTDKVISGYVLEANIAELIDKVTLVDATGASYNSANNSLVWTALDIPANGSINKQFSVKVNPLPAGTSNLVLKMKFNNELDIAVSAPVLGTVTTTSPGAGTTYNAPKTGSSTDLVVWLSLLITVSYYLHRNYRIKYT